MRSHAISEAGPRKDFIRRLDLGSLVRRRGALSPGGPGLGSCGGVGLGALLRLLLDRLAQALKQQRDERAQA
eukprot:4435445-Pyramimonas_sp.AAC.1